MAGLVFLLSGCATTGPRLERGPGWPLAEAQVLYDRGQYTQAMIECIDVAKRKPDAPGLEEMQNRIAEALNEQRRREAIERNRLASLKMETETASLMTVPHTYGITRFVTGQTGSLRTPQAGVQKTLERKVTLHLENANLSQFILTVGEAEKINIIADSDLAGSSGAMTLHAEDTPLIEILNYVSRNLNVSFYIGDNVLWVLPGRSAESGVPLETRMYRLRKGIAGEEAANPEEGLDIVRVVKRFVPQAQGADLVFNGKSHTLIARNTRENLALIEDIIEALDVCPPQVLIEARFITTGINDLGELGIDWVLNSPVAVTTKKVWEGGAAASANETEIAAGAGIGFTKFPNSGQGLNLSYQGILTDPMFRATLHALEISGKSRTLSVPRVTTVNNKQARIRIGRDFRYFEEYDVESTPSTTSNTTVYRNVLVPVGRPQVEELGIELGVTPSVGADLGSINLLMKPSIKDFVRYEYYETAGVNDNNNPTATNATSLIKLPIFSTSELETELIVQSGQTVVMGGLISTSETRSRDGVPIISRIPIVGRLFEHDIVEERRENLLIFVTATLLSEWGESLIPVPAAGGEATPAVEEPAAPAVEGEAEAG